jgi:hypothetical protein
VTTAEQIAATETLIADLETRRQAAARPTEAMAEQGGNVERLRATLEPGKGEQARFERWAASQRYDLQQHPLHYLFLNERTAAARAGWNSALAYARQAPAALPGTAHEGEG